MVQRFSIRLTKPTAQKWEAIELVGRKSGNDTRGIFPSVCGSSSSSSSSSGEISHQVLIDVFGGNNTIGYVFVVVVSGQQILKFVFVSDRRRQASGGYRGNG